MDEYLQNYGKILGRKAIHSLAPLHVPGRDPLPDFDDMLREPFPCQQHVVAAAVKMMDTVGSGFIVGEMGTGKTLLGMTSVHKHAIRSRKQGRPGRQVPGVVLCPDHLIDKWCREIEETIPGAIVHRFGPQGVEEVASEARARRSRSRRRGPSGPSATPWPCSTAATATAGRSRRGPSGTSSAATRPSGSPTGSGLADAGRGFTATTRRRRRRASTWSSIGSPSLDENGRPRYNRRGEPIMVNVTARVHYCPACGTVARDKKGVPLGEKDLSAKGKGPRRSRARGIYMQQFADPEKKARRARPMPLMSRFGDKKPGQEINHAGRKWVVRECKEPLYNYTSRPCRWSPARIIQKKMRRFFTVPHHRRGARAEVATSRPSRWRAAS